MMRTFAAVLASVSAMALATTGGPAHAGDDLRWSVTVGNGGWSGAPPANWWRGYGQDPRFGRAWNGSWYWFDDPSCPNHLRPNGWRSSWNPSHWDRHGRWTGGGWDHGRDVRNDWRGDYGSDWRSDWGHDSRSEYRRRDRDDDDDDGWRGHDRRGYGHRGVSCRQVQERAWVRGRPAAVVYDLCTDRRGRSFVAEGSRRIVGWY